MRYLEKTDEDFLGSATSLNAEVREAKIRELRKNRNISVWSALGNLVLFFALLFLSIIKGMQFNPVTLLPMVLASVSLVNFCVFNSEIRLRLFIDKQIRDNNRPDSQP